MPNVTIDSDLLVTEPVALDSTVRGIETGINRLVLLKEAELNKNVSDVFDWDVFGSMVDSGSARNAYPIGTTLTEKWGDVRPNNNTEWDYASRLAAYENIKIRGGLTRPAATFHSKLALPFGTQFSNYQAFLKAIDGLPAGTYHVTMPSTWVNDTMKGKTYQFTLESALPAGGLLSGFRQCSSAFTSSMLTVYAHASQAPGAAVTTITATEGSGGTDLGTFTTAGVAVPASGTPATQQSVTINSTEYKYYGLNAISRCAWGNNRYLHSPMRLWLNSIGSNWYVPPTVFDIPPDYASYDGFLTGFPEEMIERMAYREIKTSLNTVTDGGTSNGTECDTCYDRVFLPASEQMNLECTSLGIPHGVEGDPWEYWVMVYGATRATYWVVHTEFCMASMESPTTMRHVFQRSPNRGTGSNVACVYSGGGVTDSSAISGYRVAPAYSIIS